MLNKLHLYQTLHNKNTEGISAEQLRADHLNTSTNTNAIEIFTTKNLLFLFKQQKLKVQITFTTI